MALTLAATPLGNPGDASPRLKDAIANAEIIAAEDSRRFHRLCSDIEVTFTGRVISFFDGNETERTQEILELLRAGKNVLVVSDAGMPTISDPGFRLARDAMAENLAVTVIPGPSAPVMALALIWACQQIDLPLKVLHRAHLVHVRHFMNRYVLKSALWFSSKLHIALPNHCKMPLQSLVAIARLRSVAK